MKRFLMLGALIAAIAAAGCGGGGDGGGGGNTSACGGATKGCVIGSLVDSQTGTAVGGATVLVGGTSAAMVTKAAGTQVATANSSGWFAASNIEQGSSVVFCFEVAGYAATCHSFLVEGAKTLNMPPIKMVKQGTALSLNTGTGGTITDATTGAQMTVAAGDVCAADRSTAATGTATCYLTPIASADDAPGEFTGVRLDGTEVAIVTTGMMDVTCKDASGNLLNLCSGKTAAVRVPLFGFSDCASLPATIESWDFDPVTGKWKEVGTLTKTCGADATTSYYAGNITHWSWWNADKPEHFTCLRGTVRDATGTNPNVLATVTCELSEGAGKMVRVVRSTQTASDGSFCIQVVRGSYYSCKAKKGQFQSTAIEGTASTEQLACSPDSSVCANIGTLSLVDPIFQTTLTWGATSSSVPRDLDSHFISLDGATQIYFSNKENDFSLTKGSLTSAPYIELDVDDTTYEGPEHTTVVPGVAAGKYRFCVHNYSGDGDLITSQARVWVAGSSSSLPRSYTVPTTPSAQNVWQVYEVDIASDNSLSITDLNKLVTGADAKTGCLQ